MENISIGDGWQDFAANLIPLDASPGQYTDMRIAFYAGAVLILETTAKVAELDAAAGIVLLERLHEEKRAFLREMKQRRQVQRGTP
ncbi:hypothetical protein [Paraburkholderia sp. MM5384-R2]|uniref:hypothetical protein n=1 Tax=Paraburkholderia sp. MM5384-R2 TaxID=2723097 RepID=UPI00161C90F9|nr:hypothetical protein [Paraburkholderia sp. MM5384-R2]MBB5496891.1 hypothetical protein [Paraburkholderia sp. MM5384-R2]